MKRIHKVLKALRREGFIARWNFMCCRSCGGAAIAHDVEEILYGGRPAPAGAIFNCKQDVENVYQRKPWQGRTIRPDAKIHIGFGRIHTAHHGVVGKPTREVGRALAAALKAEGIPFEWNGKASTRIAVDAATALEELT